jgi:hypothetical protein
VHEIREYVDHVRGLIRPNDTVFIERGVSLAEFDAELYGTLDAGVYKRETATLHAVDFKSGAGVPVAVENNPQIKYYALGMMLALNEPVAEVVLTVVQPARGEPIRSCTIDVISLLEFGAELAQGAARTRDPNAPLMAGKHCQFCPAAGVCPELHRAALAAAGADEIPATGQFMAPDAPETLSADELGRRLEQAGILRLWLRSLEKHAYAEAQRGRPPAGWKLVEKLGKRTWRDPSTVAGQILRTFDGLSEDDVILQMPISPRAFEKLVGRGASKQFLSAYTERKKAGVALVPLSDARPAIDPALSDFEDVTHGGPEDDD